MASTNRGAHTSRQKPSGRMRHPRGTADRDGRSACHPRPADRSGVASADAARPGPASASDPAETDASAAVRQHAGAGAACHLYSSGFGQPRGVISIRLVISAVCIPEVRMRPKHENLAGQPTPGPCEFIDTAPLQGIYPAFPATGGIRRHPRCGNSLARCSAVSSQVDQEFYRRLQDMVAAAAVARVRDRRPSPLTEGRYKVNFTIFCNSE
jgi:hypothetical protein